MAAGKRVRLVCWNEDVAAERARLLKGFTVDASPFKVSGMITRLRENPPSIVVIDLDRLPSHGREVAFAIRGSKALCHIPIVFAGGVAEKVEDLRRQMPDAAYCDWSNVVSAIKAAPIGVTRQIPHMQRYAASPLAKKLDLKPGTKAALIGEEDGFVELLGDLPEGVELQTRAGRDTTLVMCFVRARRDLDSAFDLAGGRSLWIIYPKKAGRYSVDFNQNDVRNTGLAAGMVDYKICAVDADWSGMKFAQRKS